MGGREEYKDNIDEGRRKNSEINFLFLRFLLL